MQRARIIGPKNEKTATGAIFVRMCDIRRELDSQHVNANSLFHDSQYVNVPKLSSLRIATQDEVLKTISLSPNKSSRLIHFLHGF